MRKKAILVHLNDFTSVTPLVGGYLKAYALASGEVRRDWEIELYNTCIRTPASQILGHVVERQPDLVGFSVYTWNSRLVMRLLSALRGILPPSTRYLLGGVEVMHCAERILRPAWEDVSICNGEGERSFRDTLLELGERAPDLARVRGLSFFRDGALLTTPENERIKDLAEIPSPWLTGALGPGDVGELALFETNRGCPYLCEFCYWGGAIGQKITRMPLERVKAELDFIVQQRPRTLSLCDANFGQLPEDVEIAEHIARLKRTQRSPGRLTYNSAKNRIDRVETIAKLFADAKLLSSHAISLQTTTPRALELARRDNIRTDVYLRLQRTLNQWKLPSFVELIWPLPGETLDSFQESVDGLCRMGAQSFFVHPLLWLNNVGYEGRLEELGVSLLDSEDPKGGAPIVIQTKEVSYPEYLEGLLFASALSFLFSCRGLYATMHVLDALGRGRHREVLCAFVAWMQEREGDPVAALWHQGRERFEETSTSNWPGTVANCLLHGERVAFDALLGDFVSEHLAGWTRGLPRERARLVAAAAEFDLLTRPYLYMTTPQALGVELRQIEVVAQRRLLWVVRSPFDFPALLRALEMGDAPPSAAWEEGVFEIEIDHKSRQTIPPAGWDLADFRWNGSMVSREIGQYLPRCTLAPGLEQAAKVASG